MKLTVKNAVCVPMIPAHRGPSSRIYTRAEGSGRENLEGSWLGTRTLGTSFLLGAALACPGTVEPQGGLLVEPWVKAAPIPAPLEEVLKKQSARDVCLDISLIQP